MDNLTLNPSWLVYPLLHIEANPDHDNSVAIVDTEFALKQSLFVKESENAFQMHLHLYYKTPDRLDHNLEYDISIKLFATFDITVDPRTLPEEVQREIVLDIINLGFGSIRETIAAATARGPWGTYLLPIMSVDDLAESLLEDMSSEASADQDSGAEG